jgi:hypothetical protein
MPTCTTCHPAAITAVQSASVVREIGIAGVLSMAAATVLRSRYKRAVADPPAAGSARQRPEQKPGS